MANMKFFCDSEQAQVNCTEQATYSMLFHEKPEAKVFCHCSFATILPLTYTFSQVQNYIL